MSKMKNKAAAIFANPIPYCKALRNITGSVTGAILMQQLEYWFSQKPDGFYKYLEPLKNHDSKLTKYKEGDSWVEELGFSKDEFRAAFDKIGHRFKSKKDMKLNPSQSATCLYYSYFDKIKGETWYFRNHEIVDKKLDWLIYGDRETQFTEIDKPNPHISGKPIPIITETTSETTTDKTPNGEQVNLLLNMIYKEINYSLFKDYKLRKIIEKAIKSHSFEYLETCLAGYLQDKWVKDKNAWNFYKFFSEQLQMEKYKAQGRDRIGNAAQSLAGGFKSTLPDFSHIHYDESPIDEEAWQTLTSSRK